jgi:BMFP domain-containing protein YqiC
MMQMQLVPAPATRHTPGEDTDMQTDNRILDGMARFFTNAAGAAQAFKAEMETMIKARFERLIAELDFVPREEFDNVKAMAAKARGENEKLAARVTELEKVLGIASPKSAGASPRPKGRIKGGRGKL